MKNFLTLIIYTLIILSAAEARLHEIIREHSKIGFNIDYMMMSDVDGRFKIFRGTFDFDEQNKIVSNIKVEINSASVDSEDEKRDFHLRGHEFLFSEVHRYITFNAKGTFKINDNQSIIIPGTITLRGITKPFTLQGIYKGKGKDAWGKDNHFFAFSGKLNRKDFNINWNKKLDSGGYLVGDEIRIKIIAQTQFSGDKTPFSTHMIPDTKGIAEREALRKGQINKLTTSTDPKDHEKKEAKKKK